MQETDMDERMHTTPWFHATDIPNAPASNLAQMGIGGWYGSRPGMKVARERQSTVITISDVEELSVEKAVEIALSASPGRRPSTRAGHPPSAPAQGRARALTPGSTGAPSRSPSECSTDSPARAR